MSAENTQEEATPLNSDGEWELYLASSSHPTVRSILKDRTIRGNALGQACIEVIKTQTALNDFQKQVDLDTLKDVSLEETNGHSKRSLFDHAALKIASSFGIDPEEDERLLKELQKVPAIQRASKHWDRIPFASRMLLDRAGEAAVEGGSDLDEWIQRNEKYMRARLSLDDAATSEKAVPSSKRSKLDSSEALPTSNGLPDWKRWMVGLGKSGDLFFGSKAEGGIKSTNRPSSESLTGMKVLDAHRQPAVKTRDLASFKETFSRMTGDILKGLDWSNVLVAGGMILAPLTSTTKEEEDKAQAADLDVYLYGLNDEDAMKKLLHLESTFASNLPEGVSYVVLRNSRTITFIPSKFPNRRLQVILKICKNPMEILLNFDLDPVGMGFDGQEVWMLPRTARSLVTGYTTFTMSLIHGSYLNDRRATQEQRVLKYGKRGFGIRFLPSYVSPSLESIREDQTEKVEWFVAPPMGFNRSKPPTFNHADVDCVNYRSSETGGKNFLTSATLFFRHLALWDLAQAGKILLEESVSSFSEAVYQDDSLDYNDGPDLEWDENFSIGLLKSKIEEVNDQEAELLESQAEQIFEVDFPRDGEDVVEDSGPFFPPLEVRRSIIEDSLAQARQEEIVVPIYLPSTFLKHAQSVFPEGSFSPVARPQIEEERITRLAVKPDDDYHYMSVRGSDWKKESDYTYQYWTKKGSIFQLVDRESDEVCDVLHAFRKGHARLERDIEVREGLVRRCLTRRAVRPTQILELQAFNYWVEAEPQWHSSHYQADEQWGMFNVPSEVREKRFELTEEEAEAIEKEQYYGALGLEWWKTKLAD